MHGARVSDMIIIDDLHIAPRRAHAVAATLKHVIVDDLHIAPRHAHAVAATLKHVIVDDLHVVPRRAHAVAATSMLILAQTQIRFAYTINELTHNAVVDQTERF